jgi:hypothetical protein
MSGFGAQTFLVDRRLPELRDQSIQMIETSVGVSFSPPVAANNHTRPSSNC